MGEEELRNFLPNYLNMAKEEVVPMFLGVSTVNFTVEINAKGGYNVVATTNRELNDRSKQYLRNLSHGYVRGYTEARIIKF